jgi:hypothetical protein
VPDADGAPSMRLRARVRVLQGCGRRQGAPCHGRPSPRAPRKTKHGRARTAARTLGQARERPTRSERASSAFPSVAQPPAITAGLLPSSSASDLHRRHLRSGGRSAREYSSIPGRRNASSQECALTMERAGFIRATDRERICRELKANPRTPASRSSSEESDLLDDAPRCGSPVGYDVRTRESSMWQESDDPRGDPAKRLYEEYDKLREVLEPRCARFGFRGTARIYSPSSTPCGALECTYISKGTDPLGKPHDRKAWDEGVTKFCGRRPSALTRAVRARVGLSLRSRTIEHDSSTIATDENKEGARATY